MINEQKEYIEKNNIDFPTNPEYPKKMIFRVQNELLNMVKIVSGILEKNDIEYFISYGTLIGAIKFGGFLPWDDDIDLFLFDHSYDKAIAALESELPEFLIVHSEKNDPNHFLAWNSIKNIKVEVEDNGIYNPHNKLLKYRCLGIDLYRLKKVANDKIEEYKKEEAIKFFTKKLNAGIISKEKYDEYLFELKGQSEKEKLLAKVLDSGTDVYTFVVKMNYPIKREHIFPLRKYKFEDIELFGPNDPIEVLSSSFSNLEKLPEFEDRKPHLKKVKFV